MVQPAPKVFDFAISSTLLPAGPEHGVLTLVFFLFAEGKKEKLINTAIEYSVKVELNFRRQRPNYEYLGGVWFFCLV